MKGGIGWKLIFLALDCDPLKFYLMFLSREIYIKLLYKNLYENSYIKLCIEIDLSRSYSANTQPMAIWKRKYLRAT